MLIEKFGTFFPTVGERIAAIKEFCLALTFLKLDGMKVLQGIDNQEMFMKMFSSYETILEGTVDPAVHHMWVDVYGEFTYNKLRNKYDPKVYQQRLEKFAQQYTSVLDTTQMLKLLLRTKVFMLSGKLFQLMTLAAFSDLGMVHCDDSYMRFLPHRLTKTSGSVKLLQKHCGLEDPLLYSGHVCKNLPPELGFLPLHMRTSYASFMLGTSTLQLGNRVRKGSMCRPTSIAYYELAVLIIFI